MMFPLIPFVIFAYLFLYVCAYTVFSHFGFSQRPLKYSLKLEKTELGPQLSLDAWLKQEEKVAFKKLLENVAPGGANVKDALPGTVVASPSREYPDYFYHCELLKVK